MDGDSSVGLFADYWPSWMVCMHAIARLTIDGQGGQKGDHKRVARISLHPQRNTPCQFSKSEIDHSEKFNTHLASSSDDLDVASRIELDDSRQTAQRTWDSEHKR